MKWSLLAGLGEEDRRRVLGAARRRSFAKGDIVFHEGDLGDSLHLVAAGSLAVRISTPHGDTATLNVLGPGSFFGELALLDDAESGRSATVVALEASETQVLRGEAFRELCREHPGVEPLLAQLLARRVRELSERLLETMYVGLDLRLYNRLLELAGLYADESGHCAIPLTQEQLSDLVGGTRSTVNQILQKLVAQGIVELGRGRVVILDRSELVRKGRP